MNWMHELFSSGRRPDRRASGCPRTPGRPLFLMCGCIVHIYTYPWQTVWRLVFSNPFCICACVLSIAYCLVAFTCVGFIESRVAANCMPGSGWSVLSSFHRSCSVTWYQFSLGWPARFLPWCISSNVSGSKVTDVPGSDSPADVICWRYVTLCFLW